MSGSRIKLLSGILVACAPCTYSRILADILRVRLIFSPRPVLPRNRSSDCQYSS